MDWDGIGTAAFFLSSGVIGVGVIIFRAYALKLKHNLEHERLLHGGSGESELTETLLALQDQMGRLNDRMDFNERLLDAPEKSPAGTSGGGDGSPMA